MVLFKRIIVLFSDELSSYSEISGVGACGVARRHSCWHKQATVVTAAAPTFSLVSCSGHNTRALGLGHGPQGPLLHCHQQSRLVFKSHRGTDSEAAGANPETARLQQAPPACEFR